MVGRTMHQTLSQIRDHHNHSHYIALCIYQTLHSIIILPSNKASSSYIEPDALSVEKLSESPHQVDRKE